MGGGTPMLVNPGGGPPMIRVPGGVARPSQVPAAISSGRNIVISQPGMRPGQPGSTITVPLQTLQGLQPGQGIPTGQAGHLLVKTDNGQYQILRVGQGGAPGVSTTTSIGMPMSIRAGMAPAVTTVGLARSTAVAHTMATSVRTTAPPPSAPTTSSASGGGAGGGPSSSAASSASGGMGQQMTPDTAKLKCKNFLATLLKLASEQPTHVANNVRNLIQGLIDGKVEPEVFTTQLQRELNSSPQPCLVPFLRKSLPFLQSSLRTGLMAAPSGMPGLAKVVSAATGPTMASLTAPKIGLSAGAMVMGGSSALAAVKEKRSSGSFSTAGDEDINDVAAMGGVNLAEESQRMQGVTDMIGTQIRSCKDETFLQTGQLHRRIAKICRDKGLEEPSPEVIALVSHATQDRLKTLLEKLSVIAEHRMDVIKLEGDQYEVSQDVKGQLKFLNDLDRLERRRHEEAEREILLKAAKSRTKTEDPEKEKLKAKARELQRLEEEQLRHEKANNTALLAIGGAKKRLKLDETAQGGGGSGRLGGAGGGGNALSSRPRAKRVHLRDLLFLMEQDKSLKRSPLLWKAYNAS
eukprot:maker-scaffold1830_size26949-snap-gene-0.6 protein:Tk12644 transcript:maker-scaffold1830_size26949-snap-gene-0.6-mRNA-1 annotation:"transcription initiation factor tfiid subunit 4"